MTGRYGACVEILGDEYENSQNKKTGTHSVGTDSCLQIHTAVQLCGSGKMGEATEKINIILETLVIHFLSHLLHLTLEFPLS